MNVIKRNLPRRVVHRCCAGDYLTQRRKIRCLFLKNRKLERAMKQISKKYNDMRERNNEIIKKYQELKVERACLENQIYDQNNVLYRQAKGPSTHHSVEQELRIRHLRNTLDSTFKELFTHTLELTKSLSNGKCVVDNFNWSDFDIRPTTKRQFSSINDPMRSSFKDRSKMAPIPPMIQGCTLQQPVIFLERCSEPLMEEDEDDNDDEEDDDDTNGVSDRMPTIYETRETLASPVMNVGMNMMQEAETTCNFVNQRKRSRLGKRGCTSNNYGESSLLRDNLEANKMDQNQQENTTEHYSPNAMNAISDVISIRQRNISQYVTISPIVKETPQNCRENNSYCEREPVVKLFKLKNDVNSVGTSKLDEIIGVHKVDKDKKSKVNCEQDPLEGSSSMYSDYGSSSNYQETKRRNNANDQENNVNAYVVVDDENDDEDDIIASPVVPTSLNSKTISSTFKKGSNSTASNSKSATSSRRKANDSTTCSVICENIATSSKIPDFVIVDAETFNRSHSPNFLGFSNDDIDNWSSSKNLFKSVINERISIKSQSAKSPTNSKNMRDEVSFIKVHTVADDLNDSDDLPLTKLKTKENSTEKRSSRKTPKNKVSFSNNSKSVCNSHPNQVVKNSHRDSDKVGEASLCIENLKSITKRRKLKASPKHALIISVEDCDGQTPRNVATKKTSHESRVSDTSMASVDDIGEDGEMKRRRRNKNVSYVIDIKKKLRRS